MAAFGFGADGALSRSKSIGDHQTSRYSETIRSVDTSKANVRRATLVLGPDVNSDVNWRVLELLRHRMGSGRQVFVNHPSTSSLTYGGPGAAIVNQHRLDSGRRISSLTINRERVRNGSSDAYATLSFGASTSAGRCSATSAI